MIAVIASAVWLGAAAVVLLFNRGCALSNAEREDLPEIPEWAAEDYWTQARVDAQFRAMVRPLVQP